MDAHSRHFVYWRKDSRRGLVDDILGDPSQPPVSGTSSSTTHSESAKSSAPPPTPSTPSSSLIPPTPTASSGGGGGGAEIPEITPPPAQEITLTQAGKTVVITASSTLTSTSSSVIPSSSDAASGGQTSFMQNKVLSGITFTFVAVVALFLVGFASTFFIRRRREKRLIDEAVAFDPNSISNYEDVEKASSIGHASSGGNGPEVKHASPTYEQYIPGGPIPMHRPGTPSGQFAYMNATPPPPPGGQSFVPPERWGTPPPQAFQTNPAISHHTPSRPSSVHVNHPQDQLHSASNSTSGEVQITPTVPPDMRQHYENK